MATNWAAGIGSFASGFSDGLRLGSQISQIRDEHAIKKLASDSYGEAQAERQKDIDAAVAPSGGMERGTGVLTPAASGIAPNAPAKVDARGTIDSIGDDVMGMVNGTKTREQVVAPEKPDTTKPMTWRVGGQDYTDRAEAMKAAEEQVGPMMDYYTKVAAPKLRDNFLKRGEIDKAEALDKWVSDKKTEKNLRYFAQFSAATAAGDVDGAMKHITDAFNSNGGDYKIDGHEFDKDGKLIVSFVNNKTKQKTTRTWNGADDAFTYFATVANPKAQLDRYLDEMKASKLDKLKATEKATDRANALAGNKKLEAFRAGLRADLIDQQELNRRTRPPAPARDVPISKAQLLKIRQQRHEELLNSTNPEYRDYKRLPPDKQRQVLDQYLLKSMPDLFGGDPGAKGQVIDVDGVPVQDF